MNKKIVLGVATPVLLFGLIGVLHMPIARPVLALIGFGCPVRATPEAVEAARLTSARAARGTVASPDRPALGFVLDTTTRADVDTWVAAHHLDCTESQAGSVLRCDRVPAEVLGTPLDDLSFAFAPKTLRLVTVSTLRNQLDAASAASAMNDITGSLGARLGPGRAVGQPTAIYLAGGELRTALVEYRYSDYIANVSATNLGGRVAVREHYMSAID